MTFFAFSRSGLSTVHPLYSRFFYSRICLFAVFSTNTFFFADFQKTANKYLSTDFRKKPRISVEISRNLSLFQHLFAVFFRKSVDKYLFAVFWKSAKKRYLEKKTANKQICEKKLRVKRDGNHNFIR